MAGNMNAPGGNGNSTFAWQTEDCFDKYLEQALKGAVDAAVSKLSVSCTSLKANALARDHRYFEYWLASRMQQEYTGLQHCIASILVKEAEQMKTCIADIKKAKDTLSTTMNAAADAVKSAKDKAWAAREAACKLEACIEDSCNSDQLAALNDLKAEEEDGPSGKELFKLKVGAIIANVKDAYDKADDVFEKSIKVAGMLALVNVESVSSRVEMLHADVAVLQGDIKANLENAIKHMGETISKYQDSLAEHAKSGTELSKANVAHSAQVNIEDKVEKLKVEPAYEDCSQGAYSEALKKICQEINDLLTQDIGC